MTRCTVDRGLHHPRGAVDDPMHCCPRPKASGNSASGHPQHLVGDSFDCCTERYDSASGNSASGHPQHLVGDSFDCCTERYDIVVYYCRGVPQSKLTMTVKMKRNDR